MFSFHECLFCPTGTIVVEHFSPAVTITMTPKRTASKGTTESSIEEAIEQTRVNLLVYSDTQLYVEKDSNLAW